MSEPRLSLVRSYPAPPDRVFSAWTTPQKLAQWWAPDEYQVVEAVSRLVVGGEWRIVMRDAAGKDYELGGVYREIIANQKLVFTWFWHGRAERAAIITIVIRPEGEGSHVTLTHAQDTSDRARENQREGWTTLLDRLGTFLD